MERHSRSGRERRASMSVMADAPVVVRPLTVSKNESVALMSAP